MVNYLKIVVLILLAFSANKELFSQIEWKPLNGPLASNITAGLILPDGTIYAGTNMDGLKKSTDNGETWISLKDELNEQMIMSLEVDNEGHIYVLAAYGLYKNAGAGWVKISGLSTISFALHPNGDIYAGQSINTGLIKSTDKGTTWTEVVVGVGTSRIKHFFISTNGNMIVGDGGVNMGVSGVVSSIYASSDNGETWQFMYSIPSIINSIAADSKGTVLVSTFWGLYRNKFPNTEAWETIETIDNNSIPFALSISNEDDFLAILSDGSFNKSSTNGDNWDKLTDDRLANIRGGLKITEKGEYYIACYGPGIKLFDWHNEKWNTIGKPFARIWVMSIALDGERIIAGTDDMGIFTSSDSGETWSILNYQFTNRIGRLYVAPSGRYFASEMSASGFSNSDLYYSDSKGESWRKIDFFKNTQVNDFLELTTGKTIIASKRGIYISNDFENWELVSSELGNFDFSRLAYSGENFVFAIATDKGIFRSSDSGDTWESVNTSVINPMLMRSIATDGNGNVLAGPLHGGVYVSNDNGDSWEKVTNGYDSRLPNVLEFDEQGIAYLLDAYTGLYISNDKGHSWENIVPNKGSTDLSIAGTLFDNGNKYLSSKANFGGVYYADLKPTSVEQFIDASNLFIHPNPAVDYIEVNQTSKGSEIRIFNVMGLEVLSESIHPMSLRHRMYVEHLPVGVYFVRIGEQMSMFVKQ